MHDRVGAPVGGCTVHDRHHSPAFSSLVQTMTAGVIVAILAILGIGPLVGVFGSMAGVATVGMVPLMLTTSVAVPICFMRHREQADGRVWQTRFAPVLACLGLLASLWLVLTNFTLVTGRQRGAGRGAGRHSVRRVTRRCPVVAAGTIDVGYRAQLRYGIPRPGCSAGPASLKAFW